MDDNTFWALIEDSRQRSDHPDGRLEVLREQLARRAPTEIVAFQACLHRVRQPIDTWDMWCAAELVLGGRCSDDGFWYFQFWVIGLGRAAFDRAAAEPDSLADVPELRRLAGRAMDDWRDEEWPDAEALDYVAGEAFDLATGEEDGFEGALEAAGLDLPCCPEPDDAEWDVADAGEVARRLPRLSRMFPPAARSGKMSAHP
ncbi:DUF4240 domain-containing protein [Streptomyces sp. NPDC014734]|uniref:DUF4240 domain-containing protein n=1 Tax=Streptomyces sp. NPDC014734 TaxID=3364886 RepID=UPI00370157B3